MSIEITSRRSPRVLFVRALHERPGREETGLFIVEGPHSVQAAVEAGLVHELWVQAGRELLFDVKPDVIATSEVMEAVSDTVQSPGVLAVCRQPSTQLSEVCARPGPLVVADRISDPGNLGTIIRTAAAAGAAGVLLTPESVDLFNPKVVRSTAGTIFTIPVVTHVEPAQLQELRGARSIAVTVMDGSRQLDACAREGLVDTSTVWVVGSEAHGVSASWKDIADVAVSIPMAAGVESLNAGVSAAICLYVTQAMAEESARRRA